MALSPRDMLDKIRSKAKLDDKSFEKSIAVKFNKPGKVKLQLLALDSEYLFRARTQHFIQTLPDNEDPNEKTMVVDCQGEGCPICSAMNSFKNSGVTVEAINAAYKPKYAYPKLRNFLIQPEHYLLAARILLDQADEGNYLPKDAAIGSTQIIQLSKRALSSLMASYEDFLADSDEDIDSLPPLFGIFEDGKKSVKSLTINLRIQVQGAWSYIFSFGKAVEVNIEDVDTEKLEFIKTPLETTDDYMEKALKRINQIQSYFVGSDNGVEFVDSSEATVNNKNVTTVSSKSDDLDDLVDDDFDLDSL